MHYRILSTLMALGALRADIAASAAHALIRKAHHAEETERRSCLLRGGGAQGCTSSQQIGTVDQRRSRGHLKSTTVQDAEMFPYTLPKSCLYT